MSNNTFETAKEISLSSSAQTSTDSVSANLTDYYRFQLKSYGSLSAVLDRLSGDANLELIQDRNGTVSSSEIFSASNNQSTIGELVSAVLNPGTYYLRVSPSQDNTRYSLNLSAARGSLNLPLDDLSANVDLQFLDSRGAVIQAAIAGNSAESISSGLLSAGTYSVQLGLNESDITNYTLGLSAAPPVYKYEFSYYYNGKDNTADYYRGWVYAQPGTYTVGSFFDPNPNNNEIGSNGNYYITKSSQEGIATDVGKVFVDRYCDIDNSQNVYTPYYFNQGKASGTNFLGSESDYANSPISSQTDFGQDNWEFDAQPELFGFLDIAQGSLSAGDSLTANFKIQNTGADAQPFRVAFYLSKDSTITTDDRLLAICDLDAIAANTLTAPMSKTLYLPASTDGFWVKDGTDSYHIGMIVDSLNAVSEANENNNANRGIGTDSSQVSISSVVKDPVVNYGAASGNPTIDALLNANRAYWNTSVNGGVITYSFYANASGYTGREIVSEVSTTIKNNVRAILSSIESFINVQFVEVADTATSCGVIRYMYSDGKTNPSNAAYSFYAYGYYPGLDCGGDVHLNPNRAASFEGSAGTYGYMSLIHETLHTLGLKHPGNYNVGGGTTEGPFLSPPEDNTTNTVMTYNNGTGDTQYHGSKAITPMNYDIRALQYLYGARDQNANATTYTFNTVYGYEVKNQFFGSTTTEIKQSIWDAGGVDTLDFSGLSGGSSYRFDLNSGGILTTQSSYNGATYYDYGQDSQPTDGIPQGSQSVTSNFGTTIANGTVIENLINSSGNDYIIANTASNVFKGYTFGTFTGDDAIDSSSAADSLELTGFNLSNLTTAVSGSDLTIGLGSSGSIRLQNYYGANGSMKLLVGNTYYTYSSSGSWQAAAVPAASPDIIASVSGLTATVASTSNLQPSMSPAACMCPICSGTAVNLLGTSSLVAAIGLN